MKVSASLQDAVEVIVCCSSSDIMAKANLYSLYMSYESNYLLFKCLYMYKWSKSESLVRIFPVDCETILYDIGYYKVPASVVLKGS